MELHDLKEPFYVDAFLKPKETVLAENSKDIDESSVYTADPYDKGFVSPLPQIYDLLVELSSNPSKENSILVGIHEYVIFVPGCVILI